MLGREVLLKREDTQPVFSFKIRGALTLVDHLVGGGKTRCVLTASTGNQGAAMAYACDKLGLPLTVGVPEGCDESKVALIRRFGAQLQYLGSDLDATKEIMLAEPLPMGSVFVEDGSNPQIIAGTSTIGAEIAQDLCATRSCQNARQIKHANSIEWAAHRSLEIFSIIWEFLI